MILRPGRMIVALAAATVLTSVVPTASEVRAAPPHPVEAADAADAADGPAWPGQHQVALTFDDGPAADTRAVLDVLAARGVSATFFVVGDAINGSTAPLLAEMSAAGHSIQNHSRSHPPLASLPDAQIAAQLGVTSDRVEQATGVRPTCFRPPYGSTSPRVVSGASQQGLTQVMWNVDTSDYKRPGAGTITARALASADGRPLTILMHDGGGSRGQTVSAVGPIIDGLRARGYEFVTLCSRAAPPPAGAERVDVAVPLIVPADVPPSGFVPLDPVRVYDSRNTGAPVPAGAVVPVDLGTRVPTGSVAAAVEITADAPTADGFASIVDCDTGIAATSAVNYSRGSATASGAVASLQAGRVCVYTSAATNLIVDLTGAFATGSTIGLQPSEQVRVLDTRSVPGRLPSGTITRVDVPGGAAAAFVNFTAVDPATTGYLSAWPCATAPPATSVLNFSPDREAVAAGALIGAGPDGLCVSNSAPVEVLVDVLATFGEGGAPLRLLEPVRLLDMRTGVGGWRGRIAPEQVIDVVGGVPAHAVVLGTLTATEITGGGFVSLSPDEQQVPTTSNLNVVASDVANLTLVGTGSDGRFRAAAGGQRGQVLLFDALGWFDPVGPLS